MNVHTNPRPLLHLDGYLRDFCGQSTLPGYAIGRVCHELAAGGQLHGRYSCAVRQEDFDVLARFVDRVREERSIPLSRERIVMDEQSALEAYPHVLEPVQE